MLNSIQHSPAIQRGDAVQLIHNCEVVKVSPQKLEVFDKERDISFSIIGDTLINSLKSGSNFSSEVRLTKTEIVRKFLGTHGAILSVEFVKQNGDVRILRGYLVGVEELLGRSYCVDLDAKSESKLRLVDHRTIKSLIYDNVMYVVEE